MAYDGDERIAVVLAATTVGVTLSLGETQVSVRSPTPAGASVMSEEQLRAAALGAARRALEAALEEGRSACA